MSIVTDPATSAITVTVPATTANLGPGFDCIGAAMTLYNQFEFTQLDAEPGTVEIEAVGQEADQVKLDDSNLAYQAFVKLHQHLGQPVPAVQIRISLAVPLARGLGSSATAIVGGLLGANQMIGSALSQQEVIDLAIAIEGHPDNVVPALLGGCQLTTSTEKAWAICDIPWHPDIVPILAIPDFELSTAAARQVLPSSYDRADAIFNMAHLGLLIRALETGRSDWLSAALQDRIHQPYRQHLIQGYEAVHSAALSAGACGLVISGAGPTLLALSSNAHAGAVEVAIADAWAAQAVGVAVKILEIDRQGAWARSFPN
jgi:homoserine kinase